MTDDLPDDRTGVRDHPVRERVGGPVSLAGIAVIALFFRSGRTGTVPLAQSLGFADEKSEGIALGLLAVVPGVTIALSGCVTADGDS